MPPIVPLIVGEPLVSMASALLKPLPVMVYVTEFSVTPAAAVKLRPIEPTCSTAPWLLGSREHPASGPLAASASKMRGTLPRVATHPDLSWPFVIEVSFRWKASGRSGAGGRWTLTTGFDGHGGGLSYRRRTSIMQEPSSAVGARVASVVPGPGLVLLARRDPQESLHVDEIAGMPAGERIANEGGGAHDRGVRRGVGLRTVGELEAE